jgi:predicted short-subunit dehydrogenase-like oxidoreductase (DUF2520 family)
VAGLIGRADDPAGAAAGVDLCVLATPDAAIAPTATAMVPDPHTVVAHLSGSLGLEVLAPHARRASLHPLVALPDAVTGAAALRAGAWFAVAGDPLVRQVVGDLGGRFVAVADEHRAAYHAAACIASNHVVALLAQVEQVAAAAGVPLAAYLDLVRRTLDNVSTLGPAAALTGPASRGDWSTIASHVAAVDAAGADVMSYRALAEVAAGLAGRGLPETLAAVPCS